MRRFDALKKISMKSISKCFTCMTVNASYIIMLYDYKEFS